MQAFARAMAFAHALALALALSASVTGAGAASVGASTALPGFVRGDAGNCAVVVNNDEAARAGWAGARDLCAKHGAGLPIVRTPGDNEALRGVVNASGVGAGAWLALEDIGRVKVSLKGGGWRWGDGALIAGRPASLNISEHPFPIGTWYEPKGYSGLPGSLQPGDVPFHRGFHAWAEPPPYESGLCAWMDAASGNWSAGECATPRAVVCCAPAPPAAAAAAFECTRGVKDESSTWPLMPFYYRDTALDDIPNSEAEIAAGFANNNAYFVGNAALAELEIDEAELCVEDLAAEKRLCLPLEHRDSELLYDGGVREALQGSAKRQGSMPGVSQAGSVTSLHTLIAILSGQAVEPTVKVDELIWDYSRVVGQCTHMHTHVRAQHQLWSKACAPRFCVLCRTHAR